MKIMQAIREKIPVPKAKVPLTMLYLLFFFRLTMKSSSVVVEIRKIIKKPIGTIYN